MNMIQKLIKIVVAAVFIGFAHHAIASVESHKKIITDVDYQKKILFYVNEYRSKQHLPPLKMSYKISMEATKHSRDMSNKAIPFGHAGFSGRIKRLYHAYKNCQGGAENVAYYKLDAKKLVAAWIASPGHRRNIRGNYNLTGIGIARTKKNGWANYTQIFLRCDSKHTR